MEYERIEPFGELRADYRAAQIVAMTHNTCMDEKHQKRIESFLLKFGEQKAAKQSVEEQIQAIKALANVLGASKE